MTESSSLISDLYRVRADIEYLEQDLSAALHLFYSTVAWTITIAPPEQAERLRGLIRAKILQLPQGCRIGQQLKKLDEQSGGLLESYGIWLSRWVHESRENRNG